MKATIKDWDNPEITRGVEVRDFPDALTIHIDGLGLCPMDDDFGQVIYLEINKGKPRLLVWADINQENPTHVIDLSGAGIELREKYRPLNETYEFVYPHESRRIAETLTEEPANGAR